MPTPIPEIRGISIVITGQFNPTIFQPQWFSTEGLLTGAEADSATIQIIHPDVAAFELPWLSIQVQRERFQATCISQPHFERVAALVCDAFELLRHTPLRMLGINHEAHYRASTLEKWHELGHMMAPKEFWRQFFASPGLQNLSIRQIPREDEETGYKQVTIEPSVKVRPGVYIAFNDHFQGEDENAVLGAPKIIELVRNNWGPSLQLSE